MNKEYRLTKKHIKPIFDEANKKVQRFSGIKYFHHSRNTAFAKCADQLAKREYEKHHHK